MNGKVLITGGIFGWTDCCPIIASPELYDPSTGAFTPTGPYAGSFDGLAGWGSTATLLPDGRVLFAAEPTAEIYDPATGAFSLTGAMVTSPGLPYIAGRRATLLTNGKVLLTGGEQEDTGRFSYAELYDPATGAFTPARDMTVPRSSHSSILLPNGATLITGGEGWGPTDWGGQRNLCCGFLGSLASAELYDSSTGAFTATGDMTARREWQTATVLKNGQVLITGGLYYGGIGILFGGLSSAELYTPPVLAPAPVLFSLSGDGRGPGAIWRAATGQVVSSGNLAAAGEVLAMYTTSLVDGSVIPPQVAIGGRLAEIMFFGKAPGYPGISQVNIRVPIGIAPGPAVPVRLTYLGRTSNEVTGVH